MVDLGNDDLILFGASQNRIFNWFIANYYDRIRYIVDNDKQKWGTTIQGIKVKPVEELKQEKGIYKVVITTYSYWDEMSSQLNEMGIKRIVAFTDIPFFSSEDFLVESAISEYRRNNCSYEKFLPYDKVYSVNSDYMNWGENAIGFEESERVTKDEHGRIMARYEGKRVFNPVTSAEWALTMHGRYVRGKETKEAFLNAAIQLSELEDTDGSFRYNFDYPYYLDKEHYFKSGWVSGMAQGHALSVFARAYNITGENKWNMLAEKALEFMLKDVKEGGVTSDLHDINEKLKDNIIIEEYPCTPASYTLNGFMYAILGLYDWSCTGTKSSDLAKNKFEECIITLKKILPLYDIKGMTAYDLGHVTYKTNYPNISAHYHSVHVAFCYIFYFLTNDQIFMDYYERWRKAVS